MRKYLRNARILPALLAAALGACTASAADTLPGDATTKLQAFELATNNMAANTSGTNKMILMIVSELESCTACRSLEFGILPSQAVRDFLAESFVYWPCGPEQKCNAYTEYTGGGTVALPSSFIINPFSPPRVYQYFSTGADAPSTYFNWLKESLLKATAPRITQMNFTAPNTVVVSGKSISTNVPLKTIYYKVNNGSWASHRIPSGTWASAFELPPVAVTPGAENKLYVYGLGTSGTYKTKTNIVNLVPTAVKATPVVELAANPGTTISLGQLVTLTATLSGTAGVPTGTVQFVIDGSNMGGPVPLVNGVASITPPQLTAGNHDVKVIFAGDSAYNSGETTITETVLQTSITVSVSPTNVIAKAGQNVTFTAVVSGAPGGETYQWRKDGTNVTGAAMAALTVSASQENAGSYEVVVSSLGNAVTSQPAGLWVQGDAKLYFALPVFGPAGQPAAFQTSGSLLPGGTAWQMAIDSGVKALGPQVIVSEEFSTNSNHFYRLFIPE